MRRPNMRELAKGIVNAVFVLHVKVLDEADGAQQLVLGGSEVERVLYKGLVLEIGLPPSSRRSKSPRRRRWIFCPESSMREWLVMAGL